MTRSEVPTAASIGTPPRSTREGTIRNPPPTPTSPVSTPTPGPSAAKRMSNRTAEPS